MNEWLFDVITEKRENIFMFLLFSLCLQLLLFDLLNELDCVGGWFGFSCALFCQDHIVVFTFLWIFNKFYRSLFRIFLLPLINYVVIKVSGVRDKLLSLKNAFVASNSCNHIPKHHRKSICNLSNAFSAKLHSITFPKNLPHFNFEKKNRINTVQQ